MKSCVRRAAALLVLSCPFLWSSGSAQEATASPSDLPTLERAPELLDAVRDEVPVGPDIRRASLKDARATNGPTASREQRVRTPMTNGASAGVDRARPADGEAADAVSSGEDSKLELPSFLPLRLRHDLQRMETKIRELRTVLFGDRGIVRLGEDEESGASRFRLNLQYDPEPGLRFVLLTH